MGGSIEDMSYQASKSSIGFPLQKVNSTTPPLKLTISPTFPLGIIEQTWFLISCLHPLLASLNFSGGPFSREVRLFLIYLTENLELQRTHNGLWVDPDDQSTWLYHSWLLGETFSLQEETRNRPILAPISRDERIHTLLGEIHMLEELLQEVPDSKCKFRF